MLYINRISLLILACSIFEVHSLYESKQTFRCRNGRYIEDRWFCDGGRECHDGIDEQLGCDRATCGSGKFKCGNGTCLDINIRCNTVKDCVDGSDEQNCGDEINVKDCLSNQTKFLCDNKQRCLDFSSVCDRRCNCADCSDEKIGCTRFDNMMCSKCSATCFMNRSETRTLTPPHWNDAIPCTACQYKNSPCTQKCYHNDRVTHDQCICDENYLPVETPEDKYRKKICVSDVPYENVLIYSTENEIKLFNFTTNKTKVLQSGVNCTALAAAHGELYYAVFSKASASIFKTSINSGKTSELIKSDSLISSISVDWMTGNIFYTTNTSISVCSKDGQIFSELKSCLNCRVKLAPKLGLMFWSKNYTLMKSAMDGSNEEEFNSVKLTEEIHQSVLFTVDESKENVFFTEDILGGYLSLGSTPIFSKIETNGARLGGTEEAYFTGKPQDKYLYDMSEFEDEIYATVEDSNAVLVYSTNQTIMLERLKTNTTARIIDNDAKAVKNLVVYNPLLQRTKISNPCARSPCCCSSLCLLKPLVPQKTLTYTCKP